MLAIMTSFSAISTIEQADREEIQTHVSEENNSETILPKVKMFQEFSKAFPRGVSNFVAMYKGIATFSSEPQDVKDCAMALATLTEESQNITTESQAEEFAQKLMNKIEQCSQVAAKETEKIINENQNLPYVKFIQQTMETYPEESHHVIFNFTLNNLMESNTEIFISTVNEKTIELTDKIKNITTEEQAQDFISKFLPFILKVVGFGVSQTIKKA